jgi:Xaa-Pro aminopeptidase
MKAARPGRWEYEVEAAIEYWFLKSGAMSWGYPSIVGSGPNATILHYQKSTRQMEDGDVLLVDAGATFQHMTADLTRTYPVSGRFSEPQKEIYELVLAALEAGTAAARPGRTVTDINRAVRATLGRGLLKLGLVVDPDAEAGTSTQIDLWFPHGPVHGIGIDVHEPVGSLVPGTTFVIEPGLYIRPDRLDLLAREPDGVAIAERIRPAVERYSGIGIRIEDSLLMTERGVEVMSAKAPKTVEAIEAIVGTAR